MVRWIEREPNVARGIRRRVAVGVPAQLTDPATQLLGVVGPDDANDRHVARFCASLLFAAQAILLVAFSWNWSPDQAIGSAGWIILGAMVIGELVRADLLRRRGDDVSDRLLSWCIHLAIVQVGLAVWLSGDPTGTYLPLVMIWALFASLAFSVRQAAWLFVFSAAVLLAPLAYQGWSAGLAQELGGRLITTFGLAALAAAWMRTVRAQRRGLTLTSRRAEELAFTDALTGLANRRAFDRDMRRATAQAERDGGALTVVMADVNSFKAINDRYGHLSGDRYLRGIGARVGQVLREGDGGYRWGGDEFVMLLSGTDRAGAERVCERLAALLAEDGAGPEAVQLTLSFGLIEHRPGMAPEEVLGLADRELIESKHGAAA